MVEIANIIDRQFSKWKTAIKRNAIRQRSVTRRRPISAYRQADCMIGCAGQSPFVDCGIAPTESLWSRLKVGRLYGRRFVARRETMDEVLD